MGAGPSIGGFVNADEVFWRGLSHVLGARPAAVPERSAIKRAVSRHW